MIYLDNAATTIKKPDEVIQAVVQAMTACGNADRGGHGASLGASRMLYETRKLLAQLFNGEGADRIAFTANSTQALNIAVKGIVEKGDHIITTELEHNSVLRPLYEMETIGAELTIIRSDKKGRIDYSDIEKNIKSNTKAIICTHASNVTGNVLDTEYIGRIAKQHNLLFIVDASQTAGVLDIDVQKMNIDILCFTGHKALLAPQGTGGIYVKSGTAIKPLLSGGSGVQSYSKTHPLQMPTVLEAGTLNTHGIAGLNGALKYINSTGIKNIRDKENHLARYFFEGVKDIDGVTVYGDFEQKNRCSIVSLNIKNYDSSFVSGILYDNYGIATRSGAHCAPLMHKALGTEKQGVVRFSFSHLNTQEEVKQAVEAIKNIAEQ